MVFSSQTFLMLFLPAFLLTYFAVPGRCKNFVLLIFSLLFYSWGEPVYVLLMLFSALLDYTCARLAERCRGKKGARLALFVSVTMNLGLLCVFKYSDFLIENLNALTGKNIPLPGLKLPIGISFYTFQTMSYTIDVYRGEARAQKNFISFLAYVSLFPQLIAGPIVRYQTIADQIDERTHSADLFGDGARRFACGLAKKVLLANNIGLIWKNISALSQGGLTVLDAWLGMIAFGLELYFDFSGYSDMAIGLGKMLGFSFEENFNYPYISKSITEFWRRWHISLGTWFRDYVYIPLGGSKKGTAIQLRNIAVVWLLTGLWHGAGLNFVLWGLFYGAVLAIEKLFLLKHLKKAPAALAHLYTLAVILMGWVLFAIEEPDRIGAYFLTIFGGGALYSRSALYLLVTSCPLLIAGIFAATPLAARLYKRAQGRFSEPQNAFLDCAGIALAMFASTAYLISGSYNPFLYFRF